MLTGHLILSGKAAGQIELYRTYIPELLKPQPPAAKPIKRDSFSLSSLGPSSLSSATTGLLPGPPRPGSLVRRESSRMIKMPSRLEDDDPEAQLARLMDKCMQVLRLLRNKDREYGAYFNAPVDPVALNIPTYFKIIKEPMDLNTLEAKMQAGEVKTPDDFARLARLVFQNAIKFNEDPTHSVHQSARNLLIFFNQKFVEVERSAEVLRKTGDGDKKKGKGDKKRKRGAMEEPKSLKRQRLDQAQEIATANAVAMSELVSAAPIGSTTAISRTEFNMLLGMVGKLQQQVVETFTLIAELSSDDPASGEAEAAAKASTSFEFSSQPSEKKKPKKKAEKPKPVEKPAIIEDETLLTSHEQEFLATSIAELPEHALEGAMAIIHESASVSANDDEIDLELDALPPAAQRKLYKYVTKVSD
jgi:bromodomain-containing factor 1